MAKLKVVTVVGTRPEIIRLSRVISEFDIRFEHTLVFTGQNNDPKLSSVFFEQLQLRSPDYYLEVDNKSPASAIAQTMLGFEQVLTAVSPDAVLVLGDTNSAYALIVAKRSGIATYHMEAGNRSFDENVPEEINRRIIDHTADINLPYNSYSLRNLLSEGLHPRKIFVSGSPLAEVLNYYAPQIGSSSIVEKLRLRKDKYIVASLHRQDNVDIPERLVRLLGELNQAGSHFRVPVIMSTHPRTRNRIASLNGGVETFEWLKFEEPFGLFDYLSLQQNSFCAVSDSGTLSEEASMLRFPGVSLRDSIERQEGLDSAALVLTSVSSGQLVESIEMARDYLSEESPMPEGYANLNVSQMVANTIQSTARHLPIWNNHHARTVF